MSVEEVKQYLTPYALDGRVREFEVSSATVDEAALAVGCEPARIAKTLSFRLGDGALLIVAAGDVKIDNAKFKAQFHQKAAMLSHDDVEALLHQRVGGVCPFGASVPVYLDASLKRFSVVYPAAGNDHSAVELTPNELERASRSVGWIDVCKPRIEVQA